VAHYGDGVGKPLGAGFAAALALAAACACASCSSTESRPPLEPDCQPNDAGCTTQTVGGGGGGSGDSAAASSCSGMDLSGSSQCIQCAGLHCCSELNTCLSPSNPSDPANTDCKNLLDCEEAFGTSSQCTAFSAGQATFNALEECLTGECPVCSESGIGDPCSGTSLGCAPGLTCFDGWCTADCTSSSACSGLGPGGTNALGLANVCLTIAGTGDICVPGCSASTDCEDFTGTFCFATTAVGGAAVQVCSHTPDAAP
jgi:hypothetical protein